MAEKRNSEGSETAESETQKRPRLGVNIEPSPVPEVSSNEVPKPEKNEDGYLVFKNGDDLNKRYKIVTKVGQGIFGQVLQCWDDKSKRDVAVKVSRGFQVFRDGVRKEIEVLKRLATVKTGRPRFVEFLDCFDHGDHACIVLEKLGISLFTVLHRNRFSPFPVDQIREFGEQILESVACMHDIGLIHTDLNSLSVALMFDEAKRCSATPTNEKFLPKSCDIKLINLGNTISGRITHFHLVSERNFRAPEVILGLGWTYPCDMWSIGSLLVELCTGSFLFKTDNDLEHLAMMERVLGPLPNHMVEKPNKLVPDEYFSQCRVNLETVSAERRAIIESLCSLEELVSKHVESSRSSSFVDLLKGLLKYNPNERLTARKALAHPFFQKPTGVVLV